jgi:hypothetical protein
MPVRFQADADFNQIIVAAVVRRIPDIDFRTATAAGLAGLDDAAVLTIAAEGGRILVTHDQAAMPATFGEWKVTEHVLLRHTVSKHREDVRDADTQPANARSAAALGGFDRDAIEEAHLRHGASTRPASENQT